MLEEMRAGGQLHAVVVGQCHFACRHLAQRRVAVRGPRSTVREKFTGIARCSGCLP